MANANIGITETTAASMAIVAQQVQMYMIQESVLANKVTNYSNLAVKGSASIKIPRVGGFSVLDKAENTTSVKQDVAAVAADTITLNKHKYVKAYIEDYAEVESSVAVLSNTLQNAAKDLALQLDKDIIVELKKCSASAPDHLIKYIDTATNKIAKGDFLAARTLLRKYYIDPSTCYVMLSPDREAEVLALADFIQAERFGSSAPVQAGVLGRIFGLNVLIHTGLTTETLLWHPSHVGYAIQMAPRINTQFDLDEIAQKFLIDTKYGVGVLDAGKRGVEISNT
jgi:hypothetical protein